MSVTQQQIAEYLGISQSQVAHALKGYSRVSEKTRQRVEQAAKELGYNANSNSAARSLRARRSGERVRTHTIAVLMGDFFDGLPIHEIPFYKPILQGLKTAARDREIDLSFFSSFPNRIPRLLTDGGVDGVICLYSDPFDAEFRQSPLPCPVLHVGDGEPDEWTLRPDDRQGIYLATQHLIEKGHRRIAYLGDFTGEDTPDLMYKSRLNGYLAALGDAGIEVDNQLIESHIGSPDAQSGAAGMERILTRTRDFTAVVCFNDTSAMGAISQLQSQGVNVPDDVSVIGFDDVEEPGLTTIHFDRFEMGRRAVEKVCEVAETWSSNSIASGEHELLPVNLIERGSVGPPKINK